MTRITPSSFYEGLPCSVVSIGCAMEKLQGKFSYDKIKTFSESLTDGYATLKSTGEQIRRFLPVRKYTYYPRDQRISLKDWWCGKTAIVCILGHYVFTHGDCYYSFFDNDNDKVVAVWEIGG